jgi:hypothetical protein
MSTKDSKTEQPCTLQSVGSSAFLPHLNRSRKAWHDWNKEMPMKVEVVCNEISKRYGKFLRVKRWLIVPPESGFKECLVAEFYITVNYFGKDELLQLHINHLIPSEC